MATISILQGSYQKRAMCYYWKRGKNKFVDRSMDPFAVSFIPSPLHFLDQDLPSLVSEVLDSQSKSWNLPKLNMLFDSDTVSEISKIHVPVVNLEDEYKWIKSSSGSFTVKSAYKLSQNPRFEVTSVSPSIILLGKVWKSNLHGRAKLFYWRCISNILPTRDVLSKRFQVDDLSCVLCGHSSDDLFHTFLKCPFARAVWFESWGIKIDNWYSSNFLEWLDDMFCEVITVPQLISGNYAAAVFVIMEEIWKSRNEMLKEIKLNPFPIIAAGIRRKTLEFVREVQHSDQSHTSPGASIGALMSPDSVQINCDAALRSNGSFNAGVFFNSNGEIIHMITSFHPSICVEEAEARAAFLSLKWALEKGWTNVVFEGDNLSIINQINNGKVSSWASSSIVTDIFSLLPSFAKWSCNKISRKSNVVAHELAKWAASCKYSGVVPMDSIPLSVLRASSAAV